MNNSADVHTAQIHSRAVVWIDHLIAKIFSMGITGVTPSVVHAHLDSNHLHHKANTIGAGKVQEDPAFLPEVARALEACNEILILGPGLEKMALLHYLQAIRPGITLRLQPSAQATDGEIVAVGRKHFHLEPN